MATDIKINQDDIDALSRKLDELGEVLTPKERGIMFAMLQLASAQLAKQAGRETESAGVMMPTINAIAGSGSLTNVPVLSSAFKNAFQPFKFGAPGGMQAIDISVGVKF